MSTSERLLLCMCCQPTAVCVSADFSKLLSEFDTKSGVPPGDLCWCGVDAVALRWEGLLLLVGPYGDWVKYPCDGPMSIVSDVDCLRVISSTTHHIIRRVADCMVQVCEGLLLVAICMRCMKVIPPHLPCS